MRLLLSKFYFITDIRDNQSSLAELYLSALVINRIVPLSVWVISCACATSGSTKKRTMFKKVFIA